MQNDTEDLTNELSKKSIFELSNIASNFHKWTQRKLATFILEKKRKQLYKKNCDTVSEINKVIKSKTFQTFK